MELGRTKPGQIRRVIRQIAFNAIFSAALAFVSFVLFLKAIDDRNIIGMVVDVVVIFALFFFDRIMTKRLITSILRRRFYIYKIRGAVRMEAIGKMLNQRAPAEQLIDYFNAHMSGFPVLRDFPLFSSVREQIIQYAKYQELLKKAEDPNLGPFDKFLLKLELEHLVSEVEESRKKVKEYEKQIEK